MPGSPEGRAPRVRVLEEVEGHLEMQKGAGRRRSSRAWPQTPDARAARPRAPCIAPAIRRDGPYGGSPTGVGVEERCEAGPDALQRQSACSRADMGRFQHIGNAPQPGAEAVAKEARRVPCAFTPAGEFPVTRRVAATRRPGPRRGRFASKVAVDEGVADNRRGEAIEVEAERRRALKRLQ